MLLCGLALPLLGAALPAQATLSYSRLDFSNGYRMDRQDEFPNYRTTLGNDDGDFIFKMFPELVLRGASKLRVSGVRISFTVGDAYLGSYPVDLAVPRIAFYPLIQGLQGLLPDVKGANPIILDPGKVSVVKDGVFTYELRLGPQQTLPSLKNVVQLDLPGPRSSGRGWAVALLAPKGLRPDAKVAHFIPVPSYGEIHRVTALASYSGVYDSRLQTFRAYGSIGAPSATGELGIELLVDGPTLQPFSDAAGGLHKDPTNRETYKGIGAYETGLATAATPGWLGFYAQWEGRSKDGLLALPIIAAGNEILALPGGVELLWDSLSPGSLTLLLQAGLLGPVQTYKAQGHAGHATDQEGVWASPRIPIPTDIRLKGAVISLQCLFVSPKLGTFEGTSNTITLRL
jgi:hypothetical protein